MSEFMRRRVSEDGIEEHRQEIEGLLFAIEASAPAILEALDNAITDARSLSSAIDGLMPASVFIDSSARPALSEERR